MAASDRGEGPVDPELLTIWARGWAAARGLLPPVDEGDRLRIEVGAPDQCRRYLLLRPPAMLAETAAMISRPYELLKVPAPEALVRETLPPHWHVERTGSVMTLPHLRTAGSALPPGYRLLITTIDDVRLVTIKDADDQEAARGRVIVVDGWAIHDRIRTEDAHRRRGLAHAIMLTLAAEALALGATRGILTATDMGRALYRQLGWIERTPYITAQIRP